MFYTIKDNNLLIAENEKALTRYYDNVFPLPENFEEGKYVVDNGQLIIDDEFESKKEQAEQERISLLNLTAADVERAIYKATGKDFDDVLALVTQLQPENIDIKALKIELKANNFYRGNSYVDTVGTLLGFTSGQLDAFFETNDYTKLLDEAE